MKTVGNLFLSVISAAFFAAVPAEAEPEQDVLEMHGGCSGDAAYTFPSITITPFVHVVVGTGAEFSVEKTVSGVVVKHVGEAPSVRLPSIVAVSSNIDVILDRAGTTYCIDSAVATVGGRIRLVGSAESPVKIVSAVGAVEVK